jgi:outer membrane protein OmpA-like peptidoglycan-associated protein
MFDGAKTTMGRTRCGALALACSMACLFGFAAPASAQQELAGGGAPAAGAPDNVLLSPRDASADMSHPAGPANAALDAEIGFAAGSARLTPRATRILDRLGGAVAAPAMAAGRFRLEGHGDGAGTPDMANDLARRRAQAVANYLESNCAVAASRLDVAVAAQRRPVRQVRVIALTP